MHLCQSLFFYTCVENFELFGFKHDLQTELMGIMPRNILKDNAVPTIFAGVLQKLFLIKILQNSQE